jgi:hypothetical protein
MERLAAASTANGVPDRKHEGRIAVGIRTTSDCPYRRDQPAAAAEQRVTDLDQPGVGRRER